MHKAKVIFASPAWLSSNCTCYFNLPLNRHHLSVTAESCPKGYHPSNLLWNIPSGQTHLCSTAQNGCDQTAAHSRNMGAGRQGRDFVWWLHWRYPIRQNQKNSRVHCFYSEVISTPPWIWAGCVLPVTGRDAIGYVSWTLQTLLRHSVAIEGAINPRCDV